MLTYADLPGELKERGVRKYLDAVAKVQAGVGVQGVASTDLSAFGMSDNSKSAIDAEGISRDAQFEEHMQVLKLLATRCMRPEAASY
jgi:hypothetical protein